MFNLANLPQLTLMLPYFPTTMFFKVYFERKCLCLYLNSIVVGKMRENEKRCDCHFASALGVTGPRDQTPLSGVWKSMSDTTICNLSTKACGNPCKYFPTHSRHISKVATKLQSCCQNLYFSETKTPVSSFKLSVFLGHPLFRWNIWW